MKDDKALKKLVDTLFDEDRLASPSPDFTKNVMAKLEQEEKQPGWSRYRLPKWPLLIPAAFFVFCVVYVLNKIGITGSQPDYLNAIKSLEGSISEMGMQFNFSDSLGYSITVICLAICLQVALLRKQLNRRFA